jgi:deoxyribonuclease-4
MQRIRFGPSGNSKRFYDEGHKSSSEAPKWLTEQGLDAYEYSVGRGIRIGYDAAALLGEKAKKYGIEMSIHAPYFINFCSFEPQKIQNSINYVLDSLEILRLFGGVRCVVHVGSVGKLSKELTRTDVLYHTKENLQRLLKEVYSRGFGDMLLCLETMGQYSRVGDTEEICDFCSMDKIFLPCFDFGHINCLMQGALKKEEDFEKQIEISEKILGSEKTKNMHIHFSKIQFARQGEIKHLNFSDTEFGPDFLPLAKVLHKKNMTPTIICESATDMADDAMEMKNLFLSQGK